MKPASRNETIELLPWYENGTLGDAENEAVRDLLASDLDANRQARELRVLRAALADEPIMATNMAMNLRRLYARIDPPRRERPVWFMPLAMAASALLVVASGFGLFKAGVREGVYQTLTTPSKLPPVASDAVLYRVTVTPGVDAAQLAELTGSSGARVLQGPSEHGVALVAVPGKEAAPVLARLKADPHLRFVTAEPH